jgi:aspartate aminotransferase
MREAFERRGRMTAERLNAIDGITCPVPEGAFYAFPSVEGLLGREIGGRR